MNSISLIDKLKSKVSETNEYIESTSTNQVKLLASARDLNLKLKNFIESDVSEKKIHTEDNEKIFKMKSRIDNCKTQIHNIKERLKIFKLKYQN
jgi:hypothetical protein